MEERILKILRTVLDDQNVNVTCSQGICEAWDSMRHLNLCFELEGEFGIMFEPEEMAEIKSYDDIVRVVARKL